MSGYFGNGCRTLIQEFVNLGRGLGGNCLIKECSKEVLSPSGRK